jgi:hypothetical protein
VEVKGLDVVRDVADVSVLKKYLDGFWFRSSVSR